ncbi:hypothetical protein EVAR_76370_1 [Eumeta japonica]|uniref:Uncharacterized protein n=1 Tax=Eumeta variegata TaxID=151549 RepID=A0A4C1T7X9_EUMVA|nr:hypothetical protein EVAR_76370_1 [Eumeta japonica]
MLEFHGGSHTYLFRSYDAQYRFFVVHTGRRATTAIFITDVHTTALEFCKPVTNSRLASGADRGRGGRPLGVIVQRPSRDTRLINRLPASTFHFRRPPHPLSRSDYAAGYRFVALGRVDIDRAGNGQKTVE